VGSIDAASEAVALPLVVAAVELAEAVEPEVDLEVD
jgi:hypothetical protein